MMSAPRSAGDALPMLCHALPQSIPPNALPRSADGSHGEKRWDVCDALPPRSAETIALPSSTAQPGGAVQHCPRPGGFLSEVGGQVVGGGPANSPHLADVTAPDHKSCALSPALVAQGVTR